MTVCNSYEARLAELDSDILASEGKIVALEKEKLIWLRDAVTAKRQLSYLRFAGWLRKPAVDYTLWRPGLLLVGAGFAAVFFFIVFDSISGSPTAVYLGSLFGAAATVGILALFLQYPSDAVLPSAIADTDARTHAFDVRVDSALRSLAAEKQQIITLSSERVKLVQAVEWQRAALLDRNWRAMRDTEFEEYLVEVFCALGAAARRTGKSGDQGVDLVVEIGDRCVAVQAKGYHHSVSNNAVQEAVTGKAHYQCCSAAVITNSYFTKSAIELALSNNCALIGEAEFPDFVMGRVGI
jgi:HJR/Mrr/RecB family endonuclease